MPEALVLLIEQLVLSPTVQRDAWALIAPYVRNGLTPDKDVIDAARELADTAHAQAQGTA